MIGLILAATGRSSEACHDRVDSSRLPDDSGSVIVRMALRE